MATRFSKIELLTKDECKIILNRALLVDSSKSFELISYRIETASDDNIGFLGDYFRLFTVVKIDGGKNQTHQFFIKALPTEELHRNLLIETGIFEKEVVLYEHLLQDLSRFSKRKWRPEYYFSRPDILVLEDLIIKDYYHIPKDTEFTKDNIKIVLSTIATFHASSIGYEFSTKTNIGEKFENLLFETSIDENLQWFLIGVQALRDAATLHPKYQSKKYQDFLANHFMDKIHPIYETIKPSKKFQNVLCHRDCWGRNILFTKKAGTISSILLDFQTCRYCPPAIDVLFCIYMNTRRKNRNEILTECLEWYYKNLKDELKSMEISIDELITWEDFIKSCDHLKLMPLVYYGILYTLVYLPNDIFSVLKRNDPEKFHYYANINRSALVMDQMEKDNDYREMLFDVVEELVDFLYKIK